jgi:putative hydroxymethylpyrimidine transport system permease protein
MDTYAVMAAVVGEWMGSDKGLGVFIMRSFNSYLTDRVFVGILLISLFSVLLFLFVDILERTLIPWHYKALENDGA